MTGLVCLAAAGVPLLLIAVDHEFSGMDRPAIPGRMIWINGVMGLRQVPGKHAGYGVLEPKATKYRIHSALLTKYNFLPMPATNPDLR